MNRHERSAVEATDRLEEPVRELIGLVDAAAHAVSIARASVSGDEDPIDRWEELEDAEARLSANRGALTLILRDLEQVASTVADR